MLGTVLLTITQGTQIIGALTPVAVGVALQIKKLLTGQGGDQPFEVQIQVYRDGILKTIDETDQIIADWVALHPAQ